MYHDNYDKDSCHDHDYDDNNNNINKIFILLRTFRSKVSLSFSIS